MYMLRSLNALCSVATNYLRKINESLENCENYPDNEKANIVSLP